MEKYRTPIALDQVRITDELYGPMLRLVAERVLPYQWEALNDRVPGTEKSHCLDNFRVAAGDLPGRHQGAIFQDTDLYKWLEAVAYCIANGTGKHLLPLAQEAAVLIARAQEPDGYLNTYITIECPEKRWSNLAEGHELYGAGHLIEAAVAYYRATGEKLLLDTAQRFADLIDRTFGAEDGKCHGYPGHQEIELALVKLYRATGEKRYLHLADYFIRQRGQKPNYLLAEMAGRKGRNVFPEFCEYDDKYAQTHLPPLEQTTAEGHAVRAVYMYSAMADLALELGDPEMARAAETLYNNIVQRRMYITGGIGSSGKLERFTADFDLPNDRMYCESCASIGLMMFAQRMAALTGEARYYDTVELALSNTVLAGISREGDRYFYVNPLEVWPDNCLPSTSMSHVKPVRQPWFACACCPPNIARPTSPAPWPPWPSISTPSRAAACLSTSLSPLRFRRSWRGVRPASAGLSICRWNSIFSDPMRLDKRRKTREICPAAGDSAGRHDDPLCAGARERSAGVTAAARCDLRPSGAGAAAPGAPGAGAGLFHRRGDAPGLRQRRHL